MYGLSVLVGLLISSSKIYAAWSLVEGLPREKFHLWNLKIYSVLSKIFLIFSFLVPKTKH